MPAPTPTTPLYYRIQEMLRGEISSGRLKAGERLPSETELAERFSTTRTTVRQALARLTFEGLIARRIGLGTFVSSHTVESEIAAQPVRSFEEQMERQGLHVTFQVLAFNVERAGAAIAKALHVIADTPVFRLRRLRLVDREVIGLEDRVMLERIGSAIPASALVSRPATAIVEAALGSPLGGMGVSVSAAAARADVARALGVRRGSPVLVRAHTFYDQDGRPALVGESIYRGDKYHFTYRYGRGGA